MPRRQVLSAVSSNLPGGMLALMVCRDRECRAAFEAEGSPESLEDLRCEDCGGALKAVAYADAEPGPAQRAREADVRRAA